jgi:hypothetical protein
VDHNRLSSLEDSLRSESGGATVITIRVAYEQTYFDGGQRRQRTLPATYDETKAFEWPPHYNPELKRWEKWRWLYPVEEAADRGETDSAGLTENPNDADREPSNWDSGLKP